MKNQRYVKPQAETHEIAPEHLLEETAQEVLGKGSRYSEEQPRPEPSDDKMSLW
jgi:hypothetical protein